MILWHKEIIALYEGVSRLDWFVIWGAKVSRQGLDI